MEEHRPLHAPIPGLGLRSLKTALVAMLLALVYYFFPDHDPTFACIGAIFGMGANMEESKRSGANRFFGTIIGGVIGIFFYWTEHLIFSEGNYFLRLPEIFMGIIILIFLCVVFKLPGGVQPGGVILCIILFNTPAHHIEYAVWRMVDTGVGVTFALIFNAVFSRQRLDRWFRGGKRGKKRDEKNEFL